MSNASSDLRVLVVGGSLGGLMAGIALARAGHEVTLLERADRYRASGASLVVREADLRTVLGPDHARAAVRMAGSRDGHFGSDVPSTWAGLYEGLCRAAESDPRMTMHHRTRIVAVGQDDDTVWARADDGHRYTADVMVGADGYRSLVRRTVAPDHPDASFAGYVLWLGVADERDLGYSGGWPPGLDIRDSGDHLLLGYPLAGHGGSAAVGDRRLGWAWYDGTRNALFRRHGAVRGRIGHHSLRSRDLEDGERRSLATEAGERWPRPWRDAILDSIGRVDFVGTPITEYVPDRLVSDRMVLIGDAAHVPTPMTGRGFGTSLDDAAALARHLGHVDARRAPTALTAYEAERLSPAQHLVRSGQGFSRSFARSA